MSVNSTDAFSGPYTATGATQAFPFTFIAASRAEVQVTANGAIVDPINYSVTLESDGTGRVNAMLEAGAEVFVESNPIFEQEAQFSRFAPYFPDAINIHLDRAAIRDIALADRIGRTFVIPRRYQDAAGKFARIGADGQWELVDGVPGITGSSNNTRIDLPTLKAASIADKTSLYDGSLWVWSTKDAPYAADDKNIVKANSVALSTGAWVRQPGGYIVQAEVFGLSTTGTPAANAQAILRAVAALRTSGTVLSTDGLNGGAFTAYASGELHIGEGIFPIAPDVLKFTQDLGLVIKGKGSRKTNNSVVGRTVLLITGASAGFGIQCQGNGARGMVLEDFDLCYATNTFTGDCLDNFGSPGMTVNRCHIGTHGTSGGTRLQTARSCLRTTYDEFVHCIDTTFDGAVDGWWSDDLRQPPTGGANEFGGAQTIFDNCVFYDLTGAMMRAAGNRNRKGLTINRCSFNPIAVNCTRGVDLTNVDGVDLRGGNFTASVDNHATVEWARIVNCTGVVTCNWFGDYSPIGTFFGNLDISNNFFGGSTGLTLTGGCVTGSGNEFSPGATGTPVGITLTPVAPLTARIGPDVFKAGMARSYDVPTDSALLDGRITYSAFQDAATDKFRNVSSRVTVRNNDEKTFSISAAAYTPGKEDTGRTIYADGSTAQVFTLPPIGQPGLKYRFVRNGMAELKVQSPVNATLYAGGGAPKTSITLPAGDIGSLVEIESLSSSGWNVTNIVGGYTLT